MSVTFDVSELEAFKNNLQGLQDQIDSIIIEALEEIVAREMRMVKKGTPVDTGTLRKAWRITGIKKAGSSFEVSVYNNMDYADYVEFGHRTRDHKNWVPGKFMLTVSERQIEKVMEEIVDRHLEEAFSKL
ncbi:HK97 gp10 family phage protein [Peptoniphilus harei]|uniref:HK97 gp10 family phage protein n=1 Tax=Peptoniphilus harei TaxID=54005 RepID=UPI00290FFC48|nr:HK97 gp10 family phage protein [Peptoniphilus harei]MDU5417021.1 HK97 gp10 family phage protein [Peptoniphilus harei]